MYARKKAYGVIWDMDNTILRSHIDFLRLHQEVCAYLRTKDVLVPDYQKKTTAEVLMDMKQFPHYQAAWGKIAWDIVREIEKEGMMRAQLEPGIQQVLSRLQQKTNMVILTNNSQLPAETGLKENGIDHLFDAIFGRESVPDLKPSSLGVQQILNQFSWIPLQNWLLLGDAGIDARAAISARVAFGGYVGGRQENLQPYHPVLQFSSWQPHCADEIIAYLEKQSAEKCENRNSE